MIFKMFISGLLGVLVVTVPFTIWQTTEKWWLTLISFIVVVSLFILWIFI